MTAEQVKVLTIGPPGGRIKDLVAKVTPINAKYGPFDALLCLGDLFRPYEDGADLSKEEEELIQGNTPLPIPVYFALPPSPLHPRVRALLSQRQAEAAFDANTDNTPISVAPNLFFLGKAAVCAIPNASRSKSLRVAAVGGLWDAQLWAESQGKEESEVEGIMTPTISSASIDRLLSHPSFQEPSSGSARNEEEPVSLAAARKLMTEKSQALQEQADRAAKLPLDILMTTAWPAGITMFSDSEKLPHPTSRTWGAPIIARIARNGSPRYHFALAPGSCGEQDNDLPLGIVGLDDTKQGLQIKQTGVFWEREPFRTDAPVNPLCSITRFISLARFANAKKERWFMALNLEPAQESTQAPKIPSNSTLSPFSADGYGGVKRKNIDEDMQSGTNFRWTDASHKHNRANRSQRKGLPDKPARPARDVLPVGPENCWFCLSNPQCAKHLIVAIGTECYIAMPKGQLPSTSNPTSPVPGGGHVLIIPVEHFPSLLGHSDSAGAVSVAAEMGQWREALQKAYASFDAVAVSWEICRTIGTRAGHMQTQVVPVPKTKADGLSKFFRQAAADYEYTMIEDADEVQNLLDMSGNEQEQEERISNRSDYFRLDIDKSTWIMLLPQGMRFNLQFPRETLAAYLEIPDRADWKRCARSEAIETAETNAFKSAFEEYADGIGE